MNVDIDLCSQRESAVSDPVFSDRPTVVQDLPRWIGLERQVGRR